MTNASSGPGSGIDSDPSVLPSKSCTNSKPALSDISERDKPWDIHKAESDSISDHYRKTEFQSYSDRISFCAELLDFRLTPDVVQGSYRLKLSSARFCHVRTCQICAWRRSLMYKARAFKSLPSLIEDYPSMRFLFLTLTCKNCPIRELRDTLTHLNKSFARLTKLKDWPGLGYLKTVEVTRGRDRVSAHPHLHVLVGVKPSYFGRNYIKQAEWVDMWRRSLRVDYQPILDVQALKPKDSLVALLSEVVKYQTKPNDLIFADRDWFLEYTRQLHRTKAIAFGGLFREYFRELEKPVSDQDLIGDDGQSEIDEGHLYFGWKRVEKKYRMLS